MYYKTVPKHKAVNAIVFFFLANELLKKFEFMYVTVLDFQTLNGIDPSITRSPKPSAHATRANFNDQ